MKLFVTDAELCEQLGIAAEKLAVLAARPGFPAPLRFYGNKRYLPAVVRWIETDIGYAPGAEAGPADPHLTIVPFPEDGEEPNHGRQAIPADRRRRPARA